MEYPFDTLKVRLQTGPYTGAVNCISTVSAEEGVLAFYRGLATPLVGAGLEVATLFFGYGFFSVSSNRVNINKIVDFV